MIEFDSTKFQEYQQILSKPTTHLIFLACAFPTGKMGEANESWFSLAAFLANPVTGTAFGVDAVGRLVGALLILLLVAGGVCSGEDGGLAPLGNFTLMVRFPIKVGSGVSSDPERREKL